MKSYETDVVVIGGGATGAGVLRDLAMRGLSAILLERADIAQGTSGRFHGLLHSGGRYVVSDPHSATECAEENAIIRRIHPDAVEDTGGLFMAGPDDPDDYPEKFLPAANATGVPAAEITVKEALRREPRLNPRMKRVFEVQDGSVDGWRMSWGAIESAMQYGAKCLTYHRVTKIENENGHVSAVRAIHEKTGDEVVITCRGVINAGGPWAGQIAAMGEAHGVDVVPGAGIMIAMNHRLVNTVINRCIYPADGDILVPAHTVSIIGTTDHKEDDPDKLSIRPEEVQQMLDAGEVLVPGFRQARALHAWVGARPLVKDSRVSAEDTRHMSRGMSIIDHSTRDGISGFFTIAGGKLTTYRLMAKNIVDALLEQMGVDAECRTADEPVVETSHTSHPVNARLADREADRMEEEIVCECELVTKSMIIDRLEEQPDATIDDLRRQLRIGMGPCQGTFCTLRTAGIMHEFRCARAEAQDRAVEADRSTSMFRLFADNRRVGTDPLDYGAQLRETALNRWIFDGIFDVGSLPEASKESLASTGDLHTLSSLKEN